MGNSRLLLGTHGRVCDWSLGGSNLEDYCSNRFLSCASLTGCALHCRQEQAGRRRWMELRFQICCPATISQMQVLCGDEREAFVGQRTGGAV